MALSHKNDSIFKKLSREYTTPHQVQKFLRNISYNRELKGSTLRSAAYALQLKTAHCLEATFIAAAILEHRGYKPLVLSLESQDHLDHVIFVFQNGNRWGAIARSREEGLHGRPPIFRTLRSLALSYFDPFVDQTGRLTAYGLANLNEVRANWRTSSNNVWAVEKYLIQLHHTALPKNDRRYKKWHENFKKTGKSGKRQKYWW